MPQAGSAPDSCSRKRWNGGKGIRIKVGKTGKEEM